MNPEILCLENIIIENNAVSSKVLPFWKKDFKSIGCVKESTEVIRLRL